MPDSVFYLLIIGVAAFYLTSVMRRRRSVMSGLPGAGAGVRRGPVPGYAFVPGELLRFDPRGPLEPGSDTWQPVSLETLDARPRARVVFNLRAKESLAAAEAFTLLKTLAQHWQRRTRAKVVAVRLESSDGEAEAVVVYAPDGRGWTGTAREAVLTAELPGRGAFRMPA